jgi:molybdopterin synthase sulfur carrier subunit
MPIEVTVPALLRDCTGNRTCFHLEAGTLAEALGTLLERYPLLRLHLYDEAERLRPHVLVYYNQENIAWLDRLDIPLQPGDALTVLQNVSGG